MGGGGTGEIKLGFIYIYIQREKEIVDQGSEIDMLISESYKQQKKMFKHDNMKWSVPLCNLVLKMTRNMFKLMGLREMHNL